MTTAAAKTMMNELLHNDCTTFDLVVPSNAAGLRADVFLAGDLSALEAFPKLTRAAAQKLLDGGAVLRRLTDGKESHGLTRDAVTAVSSFLPVGKSHRVVAGETLRVYVAAALPDEILPEDIPLDIVYEDDDIIVINKPRGLVVHPAAGHFSGTLVNALLWHCRGILSGIGGVERPGIVHRLDKDTSGLMVVAKNDAAHQSLSAQLADRTMGRIYHALCLGVVKAQAFTVDFPIGRHLRDRQKMAVWVPAANAVTLAAPVGYRSSVTHFTVLEYLPNDGKKPRLTKIEARLETGRTHQIRVHMAHKGFPIWGDAVYGPDKQPCIHGYQPDAQMLHAKRLTLMHPRTGALMEFEAPVAPNAASQWYAL